MKKKQCYLCVNGDHIWHIYRKSNESTIADELILVGPKSRQYIWIGKNGNMLASIDFKSFIKKLRTRQ